MLWMHKLVGSGNWLVGCESQVKIRNWSSEKDTLLFSEPTQDVTFAFAYPYLDIHFKSQTVFTCNIQYFTLQCQELPNLQIDLANYAVLTTNR